MKLFPNFRKILEASQKNYAILRQQVDQIGKKYEKLTYQDLLDSDETYSNLELENHNLIFSIAIYEIKPDGTLGICIDADGLPTCLGIKPSYRFYKRPDNTVFY
jgi:hypothetical protein